MPISGLVRLDAEFEFIGYVSIGEQQHAEPSGKLDLAHRTYTITNHSLYIKYDWPTPGIQKTMAFLAEYPQGRGNIDITVALAQLFQPFHTSTIAPEFNDYQLFEPPLVVSESQSPVFNGLPFGRTLTVPEVLPVVDPHDLSVNMTGCTTNLDDDVTQPDAQQAEGPDTLSVIQEQYSKWKTVLVHFRLEMRSYVAVGKPINPFLLTQANYAQERGQFVRELFQRSLAAVGISQTALDRGQELIHVIFSAHPDSCLVISSDGHTHISEDAILGMVGKWLSALLSLMKRAATIAIADGGLMSNFTLQNPCPFALQSDMCSLCIQLMNMFIPPNSTRFPIANNDFVRFLRMGIAKSLVYHLVYQPTKSANVIKVMADINLPVFRNASHLPPATLAFSGTCCYSALLSYLIDMVKTGGVSADLSQFPSVSEVYDGLLGTAMHMFAQEGDPDLPVLQVYLAGFCNLKVKMLVVTFHGNIEVIDRWRTATAARTAVVQPQPPNQLVNPEQSHASLLVPSHFNMLNISSAFLPTSNTPSTRYLLGDHTENALKSWLQTHGCEILPDSLSITASVLFGWVDPLDLIAVLHISLRVAAVERRLQQEEYTSVTFLVQGGRCLMEERMYRAQMEVSLFSKAIANVCEELNTQYHPPTWQRAILRENPVVHIGTPLSIHDDGLSVDFDRCRPLQATREKCEAWLSTSWQFQTDFPRTKEVPQFHQHVSKRILCGHKTFPPRQIQQLQSKRGKTAGLAMFSEAIARTAGIRCTGDGTCTSSGSATTYESRLPSNASDDLSDDWFDDSVSSNGSALTCRGSNLTNAPVLGDVESLTNGLNVYPMVQPMKAALYFSNANGSEEWRIFMSTEAYKNTYTYARGQVDKGPTTSGRLYPRARYRDWSLDSLKDKRSYEHQIWYALGSHLARKAENIVEDWVSFNDFLVWKFLQIDLTVLMAFRERGVHNIENEMDLSSTIHADLRQEDSLNSTRYYILMDGDVIVLFTKFDALYDDEFAELITKGVSGKYA
ncbi:hypothetical protein C8R48DRAFT_680367 [Suillus tomentosus]|nr:hypothetical protein C8R48DRAFT_680367 [Suillus tomentosus]